MLIWVVVDLATIPIDGPGIVNLVIVQSHHNTLIQLPPSGLSTPGTDDTIFSCPAPGWAIRVLPVCHHLQSQNSVQNSSTGKAPEDEWVVDFLLRREEACETAKETVEDRKGG